MKPTKKEIEQDLQEKRLCPLDCIWLRLCDRSFCKYEKEETVSSKPITGEDGFNGTRGTSDQLRPLYYQGYRQGHRDGIEDVFKIWGKKMKEEK